MYDNDNDPNVSQAGTLEMGDAYDQEWERTACYAPKMVSGPGFCVIVIAYCAIYSALARSCPPINSSLSSKATVVTRDSRRITSPLKYTGTTFHSGPVCRV